ncbi:MAG: dUTP diphosphatase [Bacteroidetes bacterium]|nr:dUTP diphosphatase [Bacteroidota bacterium]
MQVNIINKGKHPLPNYETSHSAGMDIRANIKEDITIRSDERKLIGTGLSIELPVGYEAQVRPRSGLAFKHGLTVLNSPGTIDSDYRGELKVLLINHSDENFTIKDGDRIAQIVISKHERVEWNQAELLTETERGAGGYGSTGL